MAMFRLLVGLYAVIVSSAAAWAWYIGISHLNSPMDHILPDVILMLVTFPASLPFGPFYDNFPPYFSNHFVQLSCLTLGGALQAALLFLAVRKPKRNSISNSFQRPPNGAAE
jgi:hypothetical protein